MAVLVQAVRTVLLAAGLAAAVGACDGASVTTAPSSTRASSSPGVPPAGSCTVAPAAEVDAASVLVAGPVNGVPPSDAGGEKLSMVAVVLGPSCTPAEDARVRLWHTDARGLYGPAGTQQCCYYGGTVRTDGKGLFRLETVRPAQYPEAGAPPAHIHLEVEHPSGRLTTEIVVMEGASTRQPGTVPMVLRSVADQHGGRSWYGEATLVLSG